MENEITPPRSINLFKGLLLVFAIMAPLSLLLEVINLSKPHTGQALPFSFFLVFNGVGTPIYWAGYLAIAKRKQYARWLAALSYGFLASHTVLALIWYLFIYNGATKILTVSFIVGLDLIQTVLFVSGVWTFIFSSKVKLYFNPDDVPPESLLPPPPPSFDDEVLDGK